MVWSKLLFTLLIGFNLLSIEPVWRDYISYQGDFKVNVPGDFKEVIKTAETSMGSLEYHVFVYRDNDPEADNLIYMISYCDYPNGSLHSDSTDLVKAFLDATIEEATMSVAGNLVYSTDIEFKEYPGKMWRVDYGEGEGVIRTKAFIRKNRFYSIQTACTKENSLNISNDKFMDSFRFLSEYDKNQKPKSKED